MGHAGLHWTDETALQGRRLSRVATLHRLLLAASYVRPQTAPIGLVHSCSHFLRCASHLETFRDWFGNPSHPALQEALLRRPSLVNCVVHPYLNFAWPAARKLDVIGRHYALLSITRFAFMRFAPTLAVPLGVTEEGLQLRLDKPAGFEHEGELNLSLFSGATRLYSLAFTLGTPAPSAAPGLAQLALPQRLAYVGALQGLHSAEALETYRALTHRLHGLRPRDLLVHAFRILCAALGLQRILAISDTNRVSSQAYFSSSAQVFSSYDSAWSDARAAPGGDGFFELTPGSHERDSQDIPSRKRAQYRRRYALLAALSGQIECAVQTASHADALRLDPA
jgi:uncharacterized protein VirK/YbjX